MPVLERKLLDGQLKLLEEFKTRLASTESILAQLEENDEIAQRVKTIPGLGEFFAMLLRQEIDNSKCFPTSDKLYS